MGSIGLTTKNVILICFIIMLTGCQSVYKTTGQLMVGYSKEHAVKYTLALNDAPMGCALGQAFSPFLFSYERTGVKVDEIAILMNTLSGYCAEADAWNAELRHLRALKNGDSAEARDALIEQKRHLELASLRQYKGYKRLAVLYGEPGEFCPKLQTEDEEFYYLIGLVNGLQSVKNSMISAQKNQLPLNIANKVSRGAACLDNEKWWGLPNALQATVWSMNPSLKPEDKDPLQMLRDSSQLGVEQGVRLSHVFEIEVLNSETNNEAIKAVVREHATAIAHQPADARLKLIDKIATDHVQAYSDRLWTSEKGHRTPRGQLGQFFNQPMPQDDEPVINIDDLI